MEQNWNNNRDNFFNRDDREEWSEREHRLENDPNRHRQMPQDPDTYRGAYRQDISSDHRNVSTYNGFGGLKRQEEPPLNRPVSENQNRLHRNQDQYNHSIYNYRQEIDERKMPGWSENRSRSEDWDYNNFHDDYAPDNYPHRQGENTGNMAGSLSYGYDGDRVSNPDADRNYNPLTGEIRNREHNSSQRQENQQFQPGRKEVRKRWGHY